MTTIVRNLAGVVFLLSCLIGGAAEVYALTCQQVGLILYCADARPADYCEGSDQEDWDNYCEGVCDVYSWEVQEARCDDDETSDYVMCTCVPQ